MATAFSPATVPIPFPHRFPAMNSPARTVHRLTLLTAVICGLITSASAEWKEQVLYSFQGGTNDGSIPVGGAVFDSKGNLYGVLQGYGTSSCLLNDCGA